MSDMICIPVEHYEDLIRAKGHWSVSKAVAFVFDDVDMAFVLSEMLEQKSMALYQQKVKDDWFPMKYKSLMDRLYRSENFIKTNVNKLVELGIFEIKRMGSPSVCYYRYNQQVMTDLIKDKYIEVSSLGNCRASSQGNSRALYKDKEKDLKETSCSNEQGETADAVLPKPFLRRKKQEPPLFPHPDVAYCFHHWNDLGVPLSKHKLEPASKTFQESVLAIQRALKKYTKEQVMQAMTDYKKILISPNTTLSLQGPGHKVPLFEFFKFTKHTEERMMRQPDMLTIESWFDECVKGLTHLEDTFGKFDKDLYPKVTAILKFNYTGKIANRIFSVSDTNCFIKAAKFVVDYHTSNANKINWNSCLREKGNPVEFAHRLIDAVIDDAMDKNSIEPTWLCSARTMQSRFPKYLRKQGLLDASENLVKPNIKKGYNPGYAPGEID